MNKRTTHPTKETEGARRATGVSLVDNPKESAVPSVSTLTPPDPEVSAKPVRRRFSANYKSRILNLADSCVAPGSVGALLRREGLSSSLLSQWRNQRRQGGLTALKPKTRGPKSAVQNPLNAEANHLRKENQRLDKRLKQAELIIDIQKKVSEILGIPLNTPVESEET
jgi:transposase-like protein